MAAVTMTDATPARRKERPLTVIGWMECIDLPDLGLSRLKAKIDTGARTSAIHAERIDPFVRDGQEWVRFVTDTGHGKVSIEAPVVQRKAIKNTSGIPEERHVIRTRVRFGRRLWTIDLSLADRTEMTFPMIVGRAALKNHSVAVHTRRSYLITERPTRSKRKENQ